jgi:hypothetical protein
VNAELATRESADEEIAREPEAPAPVRSDVENVLSLQRTAGNASVARMLGGGAVRPLGGLRTPDPEDDALSRSLARAAAQRSGVKEPDPATEADVVPDDVEEEGEEFAEEEGDELETPEAPAATGTRSLARNNGKTKAPPTPKIKSKTKFKAPNASSDRTTVAVGEDVTFTGNKAGDWHADAGTTMTPTAATKKLKWRAPDRAATVNITFIIGAKQDTKTMTVIEPTHLTGSKVKNLSFPKGEQGAGMQLRFKYHPLTVSFGNIEVMEVAGPATNITGYFLKEKPADLAHDPGVMNFTRIGQNNKDSAIDTASFNGYPKPWTDGGFEWVIPNNFRTIFEGGGTGKHFTDVTQAFQLEGPPQAGRSTVSKAGQTVTRSP